MEHKIFQAEVKEFDDKEMTITHFISTERKDRGGDIMRADGMKIRGRPVVLMSHGFSGIGQEPIAKPVKIWKDTFKGAKGIAAKTKFYDGSHLTPPDNTGQRLYEKAKSGFMPNWSIGYIVIKKEDIRDGQDYGRDVLEWELLEYSPVGVPMNPDAQTLSDSDKLAAGISFKILNHSLLQNSEGGTITIVDRNGRPLSRQEIEEAIRAEISSFYWSAMSQK